MKTTNFKSYLQEYWKGRLHVKRLANEYAKNLDKALFREKIEGEGIDIHPAICFSRKIGVGTLELAKRIGKKLKHPVFDREIIEAIAQITRLNPKSITTFDERYPGKIKEIKELMR